MDSHATLLGIAALPGTRFSTECTGVNLRLGTLLSTTIPDAALDGVDVGSFRDGTAVVGMHTPAIFTRSTIAIVRTGSFAMLTSIDLRGTAAGRLIKYQFTTSAGGCGGGRCFGRSGSGGSRSGRRRGGCCSGRLFGRCSCRRSRCGRGGRFCWLFGRRCGGGRGGRFRWLFRRSSRSRSSTRSTRTAKVGTPSGLANLSQNGITPRSADIVRGHPEKGTAVACKFSLVVILEVGGDLYGLGGVDVGAGAAAVVDAVAEYNLVRLRIKQLITHTPKQRRSTHLPTAAPIHTQRRPRHAIVKLRHQKVQIRSTIVQNLKVRAQRRSHIAIHGSMCHFIPAAIVPVVRLQSIQLRTKLGGQLVQKCLGLEIGVSARALGASSRLLAGNVVAVLVVNVDTIKFLGVDDVYQGGGEGFFLAEAVVPAVVLIAKPTTTHARPTKTQNDLLSRISPSVYQCLVIHVIANGHARCDVTLSIAIVLRGTVRIRHGKSDDQVRVGIDLFGGGARLPISDVSDETGVLSVISGVIGPGGGWIARGWIPRRRSGRRRSVQTRTILAAIAAAVVDTRSTVSPFRAAQAREADARAGGGGAALAGLSPAVGIGRVGGLGGGD